MAERAGRRGDGSALSKYKGRAARGPSVRPSWWLRRGGGGGGSGPVPPGAAEREGRERPRGGQAERGASPRPPSAFPPAFPPRPATWLRPPRPRRTSSVSGGGQRAGPGRERSPRYRGCGGRGRAAGPGTRGRGRKAVRPAGKCSLGRRPGLPRCACDLAGLRRSGSGSGGGGLRGSGWGRRSSPSVPASAGSAALVSAEAHPTLRARSYFPSFPVICRALPG